MCVTLPIAPNSTLAMAYLGVLKIHSSHLCETRYQIVQEESNTRRIFPYFSETTSYKAASYPQQYIGCNSSQYRATRQGNTYILV